MTACLEWGRTKPNPATGYAVVKHGANRGRLVHRVALEAKLGRRIMPGFQANHHCDNRICINPEHLYEGTQKQNVADMIARGRCYEKNLVGCARGHAYDVANTYITPQGKRHCRACTRENARRYREGRAA